MRKPDGLSLLWISVSCCIFISLGYVYLFQNLSQKVSDPDSPEFWQLRSVALQMRNPAEEARDAFSRGDITSFNPETLTDSSDHRVANYALSEPVEKSNVTQAAMGFELLPGSFDSTERLARSHQTFVEASTDFAMQYNRELTRLINRR